jgi:uncharacterized Zn-binding protein involved in type VI secretion
MDTHVVLLPSPAGPVPTPMPMPFAGELCDALSTSTCIDDKEVALEGSVARNQPEHAPAGGPFQRPPRNEARVQNGSSSVFADDRPVARAGDRALTCNDPTDAPVGVVVGTSTVFIGD